jgi:hypothetical protein
MEGGFQCQGPFQVAAAQVAGANWRDGPLSRVIVQQPGKDGRPIKPGKVQPINGASAAERQSESKAYSAMGKVLIISLPRLSDSVLWSTS